MFYARIIATDYDNIFKLGSMATKNVYELSPAAMHWNIVICNFELNFAWQILSPYISDLRKQIATLSKQIINLRIFEASNRFYPITKIIYRTIYIVYLKFFLKGITQILRKERTPS